MIEKGYNFPKNLMQAIQLVKFFSASVKNDLKDKLD